MSRSGNTAGDQYERAPDNWYVDPPFVTRQLMERFDFGDDTIWDPSCGRGTILDVAKARGHATIGSDIIDRHARHRFYRANFLKATQPPAPRPGGWVSIICNPPYGEGPGTDDIGQDFIRHALTFPVRLAAFVMPLSFLGSGGRFRFFTRDLMPSHVAMLSQRATMPPGHLIDELGGAAFKGGRLDYCWFVYQAPHRWRTEMVWLKPDSIP